MSGQINESGNFLTCECGISIQRGTQVINGHQSTVNPKRNDFACIICNKKYDAWGNRIAKIVPISRRY